MVLPIGVDFFEITCESHVGPHFVIQKQIEIALIGWRRRNRGGSAQSRWMDNESLEPDEKCSGSFFEGSSTASTRCDTAGCSCCLRHPYLMATPGRHDWRPRFDGGVRFGLVQWCGRSSCCHGDAILFFLLPKRKHAASQPRWRRWCDAHLNDTARCRHDP